MSALAAGVNPRVSQLISRGYCVVPDICTVESVDDTYQKVSSLFDFFSEDDNTTYVAYSDATCEGDFLHSCTRDHDDFGIVFKARPGFKQLMASYELSHTMCVSSSVSHHALKVYDKAVSVVAQSMALLKNTFIQSIFRDPVSDDSRCGFLVNDSRPYCRQFGSHTDLHRDDHTDALVFSLQLSPGTTTWQVGRHIDCLDTITQGQGDLILLDTFDREERISPLHLPLVQDLPRNALVGVVSGEYRARLMDVLSI